MSTRRQNFVRFLSPGTFFDESTEKPIETWDVKTAVKMARDITERYGAKPYGFVFAEVIVSDPVDDGEGGKLEVKPKTVRTSGTHFIDGVLIRFEEVPAKDSILASNMRGNGYPLVCETTNGYRHTGVFEADDCIVTKTGVVVVSGKDSELVQYRAAKLKEWNR